MRLQVALVAVVIAQDRSCYTGSFSVGRPPPPSHAKEAFREYFASCTAGIAHILAQEVHDLGGHLLETSKRGVSFCASEEAAYSVLLNSRVSNSVWELLVKRDRTKDRNDLYKMVGSVDWSRFMRVDQTLGVQCIVGERVAKDISHTHYSSLTVKNAVVDQWREKNGGQRPDVDPSAPDLPLVCYIHRDEARLFRSLSGLDSMHKRGYRDRMHAAALRETLAAAMLIEAGYDPERHVLLDPMADSGTIAIEAALMARRLAPGLIRLMKKKSAAALVPSQWPDTNLKVLRERVLRAKNAQLTSCARPILANDWHPGACALARKDAESAGVADDIIFTNSDIADSRPQVRPDLIVTNPPWDLRLSEGAAESWEALGRFLRQHAEGADAYLLSGNPDITRSLGMKAGKKLLIEQGGIKLRLLHYHVRGGPPGGHSEELGKHDLGGERPPEEPYVDPSTRRSVAEPQQPPSDHVTPSLTAQSSAVQPATVRREGVQAADERGRRQASVNRRRALGTFAAMVLPSYVGLPSATAKGSAGLKEDYDRYATSYDALDGGVLAKLLGIEDARVELAKRVRGKVLETAVGTGINLPFYLPVLGRITTIDAVDISSGMLAKARSKTDELGLGDRVTLSHMDVGKLGFKDSTFDTVVDTFSLCVFSDPVGALKEMGRVVKPGTGRILLLENNRSEVGPLAAYQDTTAGIIASSGGRSCVWNQDVQLLASHAGLDVVSARPLALGLFMLVEARRPLDRSGQEE